MRTTLLEHTRTNKLVLLKSALLAVSFATLAACGGGGSSSGGGGDNPSPQPQPSPRPQGTYSNDNPKFRLFNASASGVNVAPPGPGVSAPAMYDGRLWATDGTASGTKELKSDVRIAFSAVNNVRYFDGGKKALFMGKTTAHGIEPWVTDGTAAGTKMLKDIAPSTNTGVAFETAGTSVQVGNKVYFIAFESDPSKPDRDRNGMKMPADLTKLRLYETDGTVAGTKSVLAHGNKVSSSNDLVYSDAYVYPFSDGKRLYINAYDNASRTQGLYAFDPSKMGTARFTEIKSGAALDRIFSVTNQTFGLIGQNGSASLIKINNTGATDLRASYKTFFIPLNIAQAGASNYQNDLGDNGIIIIKTDPANNNSYKPFAIDANGDSTELKAKDSNGPFTTAKTPWYGNMGGTYRSYLIDGVFYGYESSKERKFLRLEKTGMAKWVSVGPNAQALIKPSSDFMPALLGKKVLFFAHTNKQAFPNMTPANCKGLEPWVLDTQAGKSDLLKDINPSSCGDLATMLSGSNARYLGTVGGKVTGQSDKLVFIASDAKLGADPKGSELWITDGTTAGTKILKDIAPNATHGAHPR